MTSEARQTANAANALLSTGPRTNEGKARSSQNARQHGLTATHFMIAAEDHQEFDELHAQLQSEIRPEGALQQILFDQLVASAWNLRRIRRMEAELAAPAETYLDILDNPDLTAKLDRLARHQTRIERSFHRSLRELKALQTDAALAPTLPKAFMKTVQPLASKTQIAKRTQALAIADRLNGVEEEYWSGADAEAAALRSALENYERPPALTAGT
jgi:DNA gyrase/topoisomerase IV subunit A